MFPGTAVSSLPFLTVITISRRLGEMGLHSQLEGQPLYEENRIKRPYGKYCILQ